jgi:hypothetical protein
MSSVNLPTIPPFSAACLAPAAFIFSDLNYAAAEAGFYVGHDRHD